MVHKHSLRAIQSLASTIGTQIGPTVQELHANAEDDFKRLRVTQNNIDPTYPQQDELEIHTVLDDEINEGITPVNSYGIDASITQKQRYVNGLKLVFANACVGIRGPDSSLETKDYINATIYQPPGVDILESQKFIDEDSVCGDILVVNDDTHDNVDKILPILSRITVEGKQFERVVNSVDEGLVFLDGPLYAPLVFEKLVEESFAGNTAIWDSELGTAMEPYVNGFATALSKDLDVVGVVKSIDSRQLTHAIREGNKKLEIEKEFIWNRDIDLLTELLSVRKKGELAYTPWLTAKQSYSQSRQWTDMTQTIPDIDSPKRYQKSFFYTTIPRVGTITRIETLTGNIRPQLKAGEELQRRVLGEIVDSSNVPKAIKFADEFARISIDTQKRINNILKEHINQAKDYNKDFRGPAYLQQ